MWSFSPSTVIKKRTSEFEIWNVDLPELQIGRIADPWKLPGSSEESSGHQPPLCEKCSACCRSLYPLCPEIVSEICTHTYITSFFTVLVIKILTCWCSRTCTKIVWFWNCCKQPYLGRRTQQANHDISLHHFVEVTVVAHSNYLFVTSELWHRLW